MTLGGGLAQVPEIIQHTRTGEGRQGICSGRRPGAPRLAEGHDCVGERPGGVLDGFGGIEEVFCLVEISGVKQVRDSLHLVMKRRVQVEHGAVLGCAAQVQRVFGEEHLRIEHSSGCWMEWLARWVSGSRTVAASRSVIFHRTWLAMASCGVRITLAM
jgi:hypothetical protein